MNTKPSKKELYASIAGTILVLLCCFTPILVITIGVVGLGALTPYLDYILFPALAVMLLTTILAYRKYKQGCHTCSVEEYTQNKPDNK
jgi:mercuric ion transport protein